MHWCKIIERLGNLNEYLNKLIIDIKGWKQKLMNVVKAEFIFGIRMKPQLRTYTLFKDSYEGKDFITKPWINNKGHY